MFEAVRRRLGAGDDRGAAPVEFVLVGTILTALTLAIMQFAIAVYVRNVIHDAAVEGAHYAALADSSAAEGSVRTRELIVRAVGEGYGGSAEISTSETMVLGYPSMRVVVRATLPIAGLFGPPQTWEVTADAPRESLTE